MQLTDKHGLYKFYWNFGRQGDLEGLFFADEDQVKNAVGKYLYFGEVLGKHSEVRGTLEEKDIERLDIPAPALQQLNNVCGDTISGYNPLSYVSCPEKCGALEGECWCGLCSKCEQSLEDCKCD